METLTKPKVKMEKSKRRIYKTSDGVKVAGVTTILGVLNKPALLDWSAKVEREGILNCIERKLPIPEKSFFTTIRDNAASVGTICHFMCECYLKNQEPDLSEFPKEQVSLAENGFIKFMDYWKSAGLEVLHTELALVHPALRYGGTLDSVCVDGNGRYVLLDLKTNKSIYPEMLGQLAAYKELFNETRITATNPIERTIIVRIGKQEIGDMEIREENSLEPYMDLFMGALQVYNAQKEIGKL